ncbi:MAG TPA: glycosyltransferase family 2 protein [Burkholderiales bacterium]
MSAPLFSVIVATHERPALLERALASLAAQTFRDFETIVVSDEPSEATHAAAGRGLGARGVYLRRAGTPGPGPSRNAGLRLASGEYVLFLDDDDSCEPGLLERFAGCGRLDGRTVLYCDLEIVMESRASMPPRRLSASRVATGAQRPEDLLVENFIPNNCVAVPRAAALRLGFDERLRKLEDWDFLLGLLQHSAFAHVDFAGPRYHRDQAGEGHRDSYAPADRNQFALDHLGIYRKWPAASDAQRAARAAVLARWGMQLPAGWL